MKKTILFIAFVIMTSSTFSQATFEEAAGLDQKKFSKKIRLWKVFKIDQYGRGNFPDLTKKEIKKVALVAYTIYTPLHWEKYGPMRNLTEEGINYTANLLYDMSIEKIKETFRNQGIDLITRENRSIEQEAILSSTEGGKWLKGEKKSDKVYVAYNKLRTQHANTGRAATGYKNWMLDFELVYPWINKVLAQLTTTMDVDAVLLVNHKLEISARGDAYQSCIITMVGVNPIPKIEGRKYPGLSYCDGMVYGQAWLNFDKPILFRKTKKKKVESENYEKFDDLIAMFTLALLEDIKNRQSGEKK